MHVIQKHLENKRFKPRFSSGLLEDLEVKQSESEASHLFRRRRVTSFKMASGRPSEVVFIFSGQLASCSTETNV